MFFRKEINPYSVSDKVTFRNVDKALTLYVRADPSSLVVALRGAMTRMAALTDESADDEWASVALSYATAIFGEEQARRLLDFYGSPLTVMRSCDNYFNEYLGAKITKLQKKKQKKGQKR